MANICHQCQRPVEPGPDWFIVEDAHREKKTFCSAKCLFNWIKFFVPFWERIR